MPSKKVAIVITLLSIVALGSISLFLLNQNKLNQTQNNQTDYNQYHSTQPSYIPQSQTQPTYQESSGGYGFKKPFYNKDGVSFQHYWPGDGSFSNEETEILVINESSLPVHIKSFDMTYSIDNKGSSQKSGTWEKFPSKQGWDKIEYLNIFPQYYKGEPLILEKGQKGKLHWHLQVGQLSPKSTHNFHIKLLYKVGDQEQSLDQKLDGEVTYKGSTSPKNPQDSH